MLFLLTGDVQIGKTRWLCAQCDRLAKEGIPVAGVVAPGVWRRREPGEPEGVHGSSATGPFEKLGIDNVLLPSHERVPFARRRDLAQAAGTYRPDSQSAQAQLGWEIDENAINVVNEHFKALVARACAPDASAGLLVVDELGRLELLRGGGLVCAMDLLREGPTRAYPHALVVVRDVLVGAAREQLASAWGMPQIIGPTDEAALQVRRACGLA